MPTLVDTEILISGASIAGPSLAYWLSRYGARVTVVEKAPGIRAGGQPVDFKGPIHRTVLERMGVLDTLKRINVPNEDGALVDARGRRVGTVPGRFAGGEINVPRGDLARTIYELAADRCEYLFDDSVTGLTDTTAGVDVTFARAAPRRFDLVVGADGMHSNIRRLAFGPEADYVTHLGYYYALATLDTGPEDAMYNEPGRMAAVNGAQGPAFFVWASAPLPAARDRPQVQQQQLIDAYRGMGWRAAELMAKVPSATDFYMDAICRATLDRYAKGRVVLLGDAAYGNALGGFGTGLAVVGAYVLAGELRHARGNHTAAFEKYQTAFSGYASVSQKVNAGALMAPATRLGIHARNLLFSSLATFGPLFRLVDRPATNIKLEPYAG